MIGCGNLTVASGTEGLIDLILRGSFAPAPGWTLSADLHHFMSHQDYLGATNEFGSAKGTEIDLYAKTTNIKGATAQVGVSIFQPSEHFAGPDADPGIWGYLMFTANFGSKLK